MSIKSEFHCVLQVSGSQKVARSFLFLPFNWVWPSSPADRASSGSSHQPATGTATCSCTHRSASECSIFLFVCSRHWQEWNHAILAKIDLYIVFLRMQPRMLSSVFSLYAEIPISHVQLPNYFFLCTDKFPTLSTIGIENHFGTMLTNMSKRQMMIMRMTLMMMTMMLMLLLLLLMMMMMM